MGFCYTNDQYVDVHSLVVAVPIVSRSVLFVLAAGAVEATARVFSARLISFRQLFVVQPLALFIWICHQIDVAIRVTLKTHQHHTCNININLSASGTLCS